MEPLQALQDSEESVAPVIGLPCAYRDGMRLVIENEARIPTRICIKSGRPTYSELTIRLRQPRSPRTWFGKAPSIEVGLSRRHYDNHNVAVTLTWSVLAVGLIVFVAGILSLSPLTIAVGAVSAAGAGIFRASSPVTLAHAEENKIVIDGCSRRFLDQVEREA